MLVVDELKKNDPQLRLVALVLVAGFFVLLAGLWWVQVVSAREYQAHLDTQAYRTIRLPAVRGKILDREGRVLAENRPRYDLSLYLDDLRKPFAEAGDNFKAYGVAGHRHLPEISQGLAAMSGQKVGLTFVPHLTPMIRGIHATLYARISREEDFQSLFEQRYSGEAFVDVLPAGSHPDTRSVRAANICRIAVHRPQGGNTLVVLSVIDNLVKGAAGQAVQCLNAVLGYPETTGFERPGPVV